MDNILKNNMSLLMPVHGKAPFLSAAIESVYRANKVNIEFIIILDRCENTEIWETVELCPPNIEISVLTSNAPGIVPALNLGIENAKHELVARLDSDDLACPGRFISQIEFMNTYQNVVCVGTQMVFIDENGHEFGHTNYPVKHHNIMSRMKYQNCIGHPSVMFKKTLVQELGSYRQVLAGSEDYDLWLRLIFAGKNVGCTEEILQAFSVDSNLSKRRGGVKFISSEFALHRLIRSKSSINVFVLWVRLISRLAFRLSPQIIRKAHRVRFQVIKSPEYEPNLFEFANNPPRRIIRVS